MNNFVSEGDSLDITAPAGGVVSGAFYKISSILVIASTTAAAGVKFAAWLTGVYDYAAAGASSGQAWAEGDIIYWDDTAKNFTKTSAGNTKAGVAAAVKDTNAVTGRIRLIQSI